MTAHEIFSTGKMHKKGNVKTYRTTTTAMTTTTQHQICKPVPPLTRIRKSNAIRNEKTYRDLQAMRRPILLELQTSLVLLTNWVSNTKHCDNSQGTACTNACLPLYK